MFAGEQFDNSLNQYYLRARYYDQSIGRFTQQDTWMGNNYDPVTLHKYLYANADPALYTDPTGNFSIVSVTVANNVAAVLNTTAIDGSLNALDIGLNNLGADGEIVETARNVATIAAYASMGAAGIKLLQMGAKKLTGKFANLADEVGRSRALLFVSPQALAKVIVKNGAVHERDLVRLIPDAARINGFKSSTNIAQGYKYKFKVGGNNVEVKWHSPDINAAKTYPGSNSGSMWTAQIKVKNKLLGVDGKWYTSRRPNNLTHIPVIF